VFDIVIHRYIELPQEKGKGLEMLLDFLGELYKFHSECFRFVSLTVAAKK